MQTDLETSEETVYRATQCAKEAFLEACSTLYNDILNSVDLKEGLTGDVNECDWRKTDLTRRQMEIASQGAQLSEVAPQLANIVTHKLFAVNRAMENAISYRRSSIDDNGKENLEATALSRLRKWIFTTDEELVEIEIRVAQSSMPHRELDQFLQEQKAFQKRIESEGRSLTRDANKKFERNSQASEEESDPLAVRREQHLKNYTQRWYGLWIRSLSVIVRIEQLLGLQEEDYSDLSDDSREPPIKKPRTAELSVSRSVSNDLQESEEDTIPFTEDEYERICEKPNMSIRVNGNASSVAEDDVEHQPDVGYSSGENSVSEFANGTSCERTGMNASDSERRLRIESSPVKSFYKTVPLDDAGVTDTESPRMSVPCFITQKHNSDVLTDSLLVNVEENEQVHSVNDLEDVLALMDNGCDSETSSNYFQSQIDFLKQGTRWREFSSVPRNKPSSQGSLSLYKQNSCDASSEESEEEGYTGLTSMETSATESQCTSISSLKRRHKPRTNRLISSMLKSSLFGNDLDGFDTSMCSHNSQPQTSEPSTSNFTSLSFHMSPLNLNYMDSARSGQNTRRKLRIRRFPRSASEVERLSKWMSASTHSAPGAPVFCANPFQDSDGTAPEQSDTPPYEWDDYNPPAKSEHGELEQRLDSSVLTLDEDYQMHFGDDVRRLIAESRASLRSATALINRQPTQQSLEDLRIMAKANAERLASMVSTSPRLCVGNMNDLDEVSRDWNSLLATIDSLATPVSFNVTSSDDPYSAILSKLEKFALTLKCLQENGEYTKPALCSLSSIRSLDDVVDTLKDCNEIRGRLVAEREELQSLLCSDVFSDDLVELIGDFVPLSAQFEDAIEKVEQLVQQVERVRQNWSDWAETQKHLQNMIFNIGDQLAAMRKGDNNCNQIASELELCQERMNRLETVCNYLTASLSELPDHSSAPKAMNFNADLARYSSAISELKSKFESLRGSLIVDKATSTYSEEKLRGKLTDKVLFATVQPGVRVHRVNWCQLIILFSTALAFFAWFLSTNSRDVNNWRNAPGIHLEYVNGPPPM